VVGARQRGEPAAEHPASCVAPGAYQPGRGSRSDQRPQLSACTSPRCRR
jgi:hypothetical protein